MKSYDMITRATGLLNQLIPVRHQKSALLLPDDHGLQIRRELKQVMKDWKLSGQSESDVMDAAYALAALIDEAIMLSVWPGKVQWSEHLLQVELFSERLAGVHFYDRVTRLIEAPNRSISVLTMYHACLALGFKGQYIVGQGEQIEIIKNVLASIIMHDMKSNNTRLMITYEVVGTR